MARGNPKLSEEVQRFIVGALACFDTPSEVADAVKERYDINLSRQSVAHYDPEHSKDVAKKWRELFAATRRRFLEDEAEAAIAHQPYRLRQLDRILREALKAKNRVLALQALEQAAKEKGGVFTNARQLSGSLTIGIDNLLEETDGAGDGAAG